MNEIETLVWYYELTDELIISPYVDAMFYALNGNIRWHLLTCIGNL